MPVTSTRRRLRLPPSVVPWNPDDDEIEIDPMLRPRPVLVPPTATVSTVVPSPAIGPPPIAVNRSRPQRIPTLPGEELAAEQQYGHAVEAFRPQPRGWKSRLAFAGLNALAGLGQGGIGGAIGGGLASLGIAAVDPTVPDKFWKYRTQAESEGRLQRLRGQRREGLEDELIQARVDETRAQAEQRRNPRPDPTKLVETVLPDGTTVLTPAETGVVTGRPRVKGLLEGAPTAADPDGNEFYVDAAGRPIPDPVNPDRPLYKSRNLPKPEKPDDAPFVNQNVRTNISEMERERNGIGEALKTTPAQIQTINAQGYQVTEPNPAYNDYMKRYRELDNEIREQRLKLKPERPRVSSPARLNEADIREAARQRGLDPDTAVERARKRKLL